MKFHHVVILGGGFSGLLSAYMLADYFTNVSVIERDDLLKPRRRLPQQPHLHVLMQRGQILLNSLMPDIMPALQAAGMPLIDWASDTKWHGPFGVYPQYESSIKTLTFSRGILDKHMLQQIQSKANIKLITGVCERIIFRANKAVAIAMREVNHDPAKVIHADLIIDARGRNSDIRDSLSKAGYHLQAAQIVNPNIGYASCVFKKSTENPCDFKQIYLQIRHGLRHQGAVISAVDADHMVVTALGIGQHKPQRDPEKYHSFLTSLKAADLQQFLTQLTPVSNVVLYRNIINRHQYFGRARQWPYGLIVIGDAACLLNPVYGQGMTIAAKQVASLQDSMQTLKDGKIPQHWEHQFQKKVDRINLLPWLLVNAEDSRAQDPLFMPFYLRLLHRYLDSIFMLAIKHKSIHLTLINVIHMMKHPAAFFHPSIFFKVLRHSFTRNVS